ncbi:MAG TPA: glutaredoxin family protein [Galbitalea sp.]
MPTDASVTLLSRPDCHLCDDAREIVEAVVAANPRATLTELSITEDPALAERYAEEIPVVMINGRVHNIWRVNPERLTAALLEATQ